MTPQQKLKHLILIQHEEFGDDPETLDFAKRLTAEAVDDQFTALYENGELWDAENEIRCGGLDTGLPCESSRHYESKAVACQYLDGSWVGWTYWYGGGKHGEPEAVEWISDARDLTCVEEEKVVVVRTFAIADVAA